MRGARAFGLVSLAALVVVSGCLAAGSVTTPTPKPPDSPERADCAAWVSFYGLSGPAQRTWAPDRVAIGYTLPPGASVHFVAFENGAVIGSTHSTTADLEHGVTADGDGVPLEEPLDGSHVIQVRTYADSNGNGVFDPEVDEPCRYEGELVRTDPRRIDFTRFHSDTPSPTPSPGQ